ncbi:MAG TPA: MIP/aquaporin family protein, partial [Anaerolineae bacterium]|nr:MIP/aquaporin family protein [Anaerolineae bacterium]
MSILLGELIGTMMLIILGDGVVANVVLAKNKGQGGGGGGAWIVITTGWAFAVLIGVNAAIAFGSAGAHINPAVTVAFVVAGITPAADIPFYFIGQFVGAFIGGVIVWLAYLPHFDATRGDGSEGAKLAVFSTGPAIRNTTTNLICEIIGTAVLVLGVASLFQASTPVTGVAMAGGLGPFLVACLVWGIGLSLGGPTGYAINPARDLGPRIAHFVLPIAGKGDSDWGYSWIPVVGPIIGGIIAVVLLII